MAPSTEAQLLRNLEELQRRLERSEAEKDKALWELQAVKAASAIEDCHVLSRALDAARSVYRRASGVPVVGRFVRLGLRVADVGVRRLTPWSSCAELDAKVDSLVPYLDAQVIGPQLRVTYASAMALGEPLARAALEIAHPYIEAAKPYQEYLGAKAQSAFDLARPVFVRTRAAVQPALAPIIAQVEEEVEKLAEEVDASTDAVLREVSPERIFDDLKHGVEAAAECVAAHADDARDIANTFAETINERCSAAPEPVA
mmetsp:Transcript_78670/g.218448  ORF Transcript_78670/g.218448 Transcript_78670/m.218448 type:complete len:258 (+) Transcript_78670:64-837(+)